MIVIIDYNIGNVASIKNMLARLGYQAMISKKESDIMDAEKIILPGVGSFDYGMTNLENTGVLGILHKKKEDDRCKFLGICLGMQLMCNSSEEGQLPGLGWVDAEVRKFNVPGKKVPHMGWNMIMEKNGNVPLTDGLTEEQKRFYFVHSYYVSCNNPDNVLTYTEYGNRFVSSFNNGNVYGVQFHPEKSHKHGMRLLDNFINI